MPKISGELGPLERSVMEFIWDDEGEVTVRDVLVGLKGKALAYTTLMTVLDRLQHKKLLSRRRVGRAYVYRQAVSREEYLAGLMGSVLASSDDRRMALLGFVRSVDEDDLAELRRMIRTVERERKRTSP
jgi:predicted transcriptional regulator